MKKQIKELIRSFGYEISKSGVHPDKGDVPADMQEETFRRAYLRVKDHSFTSIEPLYNLYHAVRYVQNAGIPGDLVECGVWKGGSAMMMALAMQGDAVLNNKIWLYDTFEGMTEPGKEDVDFRGDTAGDLLKKQPRENTLKNIWCLSSLEEVKENMRSTGFPEERCVFVKGKVEETIPASMPEQISILRLDTDWYASTLHELEHLYPRLSKGGVLILDDYGHWQGARKAVDEYFSRNKITILLQRIDYSVRVAVKA